LDPEIFGAVGTLFFSCFLDFVESHCLSAFVSVYIYWSAIYCMDNGYSLLQTSQEINKYFTRILFYCFLSLFRSTSLHAPLSPSHLRPFCPHCVDVLTLTRSTHSDMVVIIQCRCLHKTCCFSLIVIFILISLGNEVFSSLRTLDPPKSIPCKSLASITMTSLSPRRIPSPPSQQVHSTQMAQESLWAAKCAGCVGHGECSGVVFSHHMRRGSFQTSELINIIAPSTIKPHWIRQFHILKALLHCRQPPPGVLRHMVRHDERLQAVRPEKDHDERWKAEDLLERRAVVSFFTGRGILTLEVRMTILVLNPSAVYNS